MAESDLYSKLMALRLEAAGFADEAADNSTGPGSAFEARERGRASAFAEAAGMVKIFEETVRAQQLISQNRLNTFIKIVFEELSAFSEMEPEDSEDWQSWYYAAFDMVSDSINTKIRAGCSDG